MRILKAVLTGFSVSMATIGILFKFQDCTQPHLYLLFCLLCLATGLSLRAIGYSKLKSDCYPRILMQNDVHGGLYSFFFIHSERDFFGIWYRSYPEYIETIKESIADPNDEVLWYKVGEGT